MKQTIKALLALAVCCSVAVESNAVPAKKGVKRTVTLADGTRIETELKGDEYCSWWQAADGACFDKAKGADHFVKIDAAARCRATQARRMADQEAGSKRLKAARASMRKGEDKGLYIGKKKGIIILAAFSNQKFGLSHNQKFYNKVANEENYTTSLGFVASIRDYFKAQSNGKFDLEFDVVGPYTLKKENTYYGQNDENGSDKYAYKMVQEACQMADKDVNFQDYDWDGDGYVEQVFVVYAGDGAHATDNDALIWPHKSQLRSFTGSSYMTDDNNVKVDVYACASEYTMNSSAVGARRNVDGIGTICHEYSHCLGLYDHYDTQSNRNYGMGDYDLMCSGSYNGNSFRPANYTAYEKWAVGWLEPKELSKATTVKNMPCTGQSYGSAFVVYNETHPDEYYIIENRQQNYDRFDQALPGSGLMIMHVDYKKEIWDLNILNSIVNFSSLYGPQYAAYDNDHERMTFFNATPSKNGQYSLYPADGNNALTDSTEPYAILYNGRSAMGKPITNITQNADGTVSFDFMGGSKDNVITGIEAVNADSGKRAGAVYTVDGRRASGSLDALGHGLYIVNGKKVIK